ncbi:MAG: hypothetical protein ACKVU4_14675 [Phycisphaerales bacterium]
MRFIFAALLILAAAAVMGIFINAKPRGGSARRPSGPGPFDR